MSPAVPGITVRAAAATRRSPNRPTVDAVKISIAPVVAAVASSGAGIGCSWDSIIISEFPPDG
jgi:hypothetical protein